MQPSLHPVVPPRTCTLSQIHCIEAKGERLAKSRPCCVEWYYSTSHFIPKTFSTHKILFTFDPFFAHTEQLAEGNYYSHCQKSFKLCRICKQPYEIESFPYLIRLTQLDAHAHWCFYYRCRCKAIYSAGLELSTLTCVYFVFTGVFNSSQDRMTF